MHSSVCLNLYSQVLSVLNVEMAIRTVRSSVDQDPMPTKKGWPTAKSALLDTIVLKSAEKVLLKD